MAELLKPDICIIGGGSGGLAAAMAAAACRVPVVLVETRALGGRRLSAGLPALALLGAARRVFVPPFGHAVQSDIHAAVRDMARNVSKERLTALGVQVIEGIGRFADAATVVAGDTVRIKARRFIIATGSRPAPPPIPGLAGVPYLTEESVFGLRDCPQHLIVLGADAMGLEFADAFRRFGAEVSVLDSAEPLAGEDAECAAVLLNQLARRGIAVRGGIRIERVVQAGTNIQVTVAGPAGAETIEGSHLLVAGPRQANLDALDLDAAGIAYEPVGIIVNRKLKSSNKRVYAIGSAALMPHRRRQQRPAGVTRDSHAAVHHGSLAVRNALLRWPARLHEATVPRIVYTEPELAHVGLTENEARQQRHKINVLRWPYRENDRARLEQRTDGHIKVVTNRWGRVLGATIVGAEARELIAAWTLAVAQRLSIRAMAGLAPPQASFAEIGKRAAGTYLLAGLTSSWVGRLLGWLRRLG